MKSELVLKACICDCMSGRDTFHSEGCSHWQPPSKVAHDTADGLTTDLEGSVAARMVKLLLLLLLFPPMDWRVHTMKCSKPHPIRIPHEQYQPGDILLGGISSLITYTQFLLLFQDRPSEKLFDVPE